MIAEATDPSSAPTARARVLAVGLAVGFVVASVALRLLHWGALSFLGEKSAVRDTLTGATMLFAIAALTVVMHRRRPAHIKDRSCSGERELRLCASFCSRAHSHIEDALTHFNQNDDALLKAIADDCNQGHPCPFDAVL